MITNLIQVIQKIGLCICLWDVLWASEGLIGHGTGLVNVNGEPGPGRFRYWSSERLTVTSRVPDSGLPPL